MENMRSIAEVSGIAASMSSEIEKQAAIAKATSNLASMTNTASAYHKVMKGVIMPQ